VAKQQRKKPQRIRRVLTQAEEEMLAEWLQANRYIFYTLNLLFIKI